MKKEPYIIIAEEIAEYCEKFTSPESELLNNLNRETHLKVVNPRMLSGYHMGRFLSMISKIIAPSTILEIGTYTGYSAICLAEGLREKGKIHTIEANVELENIISKYISQSGLQHVIETHFGNALEIVPSLNKVFDLVFIDASKEEYPLYYEMIIDKVHPGGIILADNTLWDGKVLNPDDTEAKAIHEFNKIVQQDNRVENVLLPIRDGLMMIRKKSD